MQSKACMRCRSDILMAMRSKKWKRKVGDRSPESILDLMGTERVFRGPHIQDRGDRSVTHCWPRIKGHSHHCQSPRLKLTLCSELSREDSAAFSPSYILEECPMTEHVDYSSVDWFCFNLDCRS